MRLSETREAEKGIIGERGLNIHLLTPHTHIPLPTNDYPTRGEIKEQIEV